VAKKKKTRDFEHERNGLQEIDNPILEKSRIEQKTRSGEDREYSKATEEKLKELGYL